MHRALTSILIILSTQLCFTLSALGQQAQINCRDFEHLDKCLSDYYLELIYVQGARITIDNWSMVRVILKDDTQIEIGYATNVKVGKEIKVKGKPFKFECHHDVMGVCANALY